MTIAEELPVTIAEAALDNAQAMTAIDRFLDDAAEATPFHRPAWLRAVAKGCGQEGRFLIARDGKDAICGILPLTVMRSRLFGRALVSSGFAVGGGALAVGPHVAQQLCERAWKLTEQYGCPSLELRGGLLPDRAGWQREADAYLGFARPLADDPEAQLLAIPRKQRAEVRRALNGTLTVRIGREARDLRDHYRVYAESVRNLGTPVFPRRLFAAMLENFGANADILTILDGEEPVASVLSLYEGKTVYPYWGGGRWVARQLRANDLLYYALMNHARARGCTRFDFGRSKVGTGPAAFKKNWGFEGVPLAYVKRTADGAAAREINPLSPKYRLQVALWKKLPLSVANRIGPLLSRGLG